jgi:Zn finger protein HypA/HybF involved in hydrogenase expression
MSKYFELDDDEQSICLDCKHTGYTHAEHEIEGQEEAEVVCPKCYSTYYFVISEEEKKCLNTL